MTSPPVRLRRAVGGFRVGGEERGRCLQRRSLSAQPPPTGREPRVARARPLGLESGVRDLRPAPSLRSGNLAQLVPQCSQFQCGESRVVRDPQVLEIAEHLLDRFGSFLSIPEPSDRSPFEPSHSRRRSKPKKIDCFIDRYQGQPLRWQTPTLRWSTPTAGWKSWNAHWRDPDFVWRSWNVRERVLVVVWGSWNVRWGASNVAWER